MTGFPHSITATRGDAGRRLDLMLRRHLAGIHAATRTRVQAWIENGQVSINGTQVRRAARRVALGDAVTIALPGPLQDPAHAEAPRGTAAEDLPLDVLYEDECLLALDKPAGVVVHPAYKNTTGTVMNALLWRARHWPAPQRPSIVGRLDKLTSGIVVVAKTAAAHAALQRTMARADAVKDYLAVVYGRVNVPSGAIRFPLRRDPGDRRKVIVSETVEAQSLTRFERLGSVAAPAAGVSLLRCRLVTGRMHQIRVHLAARGWPVVGDPVYGEPRWSNVRDPVLATALRMFPRQALHAWRVALTHPSTGARLLLEAPAPRDLAELLTATGLSERADPCSIHLHPPGEPIGATLRSSLTRALEQRWLA
ncbi:MAG TPA: RluA family pseudouridine synthase [Vicinamibacterales bacterium]|nr:RluA family pseudouridine synthase [Vicinamibacterales bacterium]